MMVFDDSVPCLCAMYDAVRLVFVSESDQRIAVGRSGVDAALSERCRRRQAVSAGQAPVGSRGGRATEYMVAPWLALLNV